MEAECLPFTAVPHATRLFADFLYGFDSVASFYARLDCDPAALKGHATALVYPSDRRKRMVAILERQNCSWGAAPEALAAIERLRSGAAAVVTGQQVSLFGGPAFALYKALTAVKLARHISQAGVECVPVFWLATQDHDFAEIGALDLLDQGHRLCRLEVQSTARAGAPVGAVALGPQIASVVAQLGEIIGRGTALEAVERSYTPEATVGEAFARLMAALLGRFGLVLMDPSDPEAQALAQPLYLDALRRAAEIDAALADRGGELEGRGYHQQVKVTEASTLLFALEDGVRLPLHRANRHFTVGQRRYAPEEVEARLSTHPEQFSANVLLRPVVEDFLLPTLAYIGGPAEVAYFAQGAVVYERLLGRITPIIHRFSATLVEPRLERLLHRYRLSLPDLFHSGEHTRALLAAHSLPEQLDQAFQQASQALEASLPPLVEQLERLDRTLVEAGRRASSKMRYQMERLRGRAARAQLRRTRELENHADQLSAALYPHKGLQERSLAGIGWLARYGPELLDQLLDAVDVGCPDHQIIHL